VFLLSALYLLRSVGPTHDLSVFARYAETWEAAGLAALYQAHDVEYPPLAVATMLAAQRLRAVLPADRLARFAGGPPRQTDNVGPFQSAYRALMFLTHGLVFVLLLLLLRRCCPGEAPRERLERLAAFLLAGYFLRMSLYNQLDLLLSALIAAALLLLLSRARPAWSGAALALAVGLKVVPLILVPLWALASLPAGAFARPWRGRALVRLGAACLGRGALLAAMVLLLFAPFALAAGPRCLAFLGYHRARGIQFESTYAALLGTLHLLGYSIQVFPAYGSCDVRSALSPLLAGLAPFVAGGLLLAAVGLLAATRVRQGRLYPQEVVSFALLFLLLLLAANKVFSPQYVLWVLPLAPLVPLTGWARRAFPAGFVGLCAVTWLICPRYMGAVLTPTPFGTALLLARSLLLFGLIAAVAGLLLRRCLQAPGRPEVPAS
jgi:hypothetical protein